MSRQHQSTRAPEWTPEGQNGHAEITVQAVPCDDVDHDEVYFYDRQGPVYPVEEWLQARESDVLELGAMR